MSEDDDDSDSSEYLVWIIIAIIGLMLVGSIIYYFKVYQAGAVKDNECYTSIETQSKLVSISNQEIVPDINCPTNQISIPKQDSDKAANAKIAKAWYSCWKDWHRGQVNLFKDSGIYCHVCDIITFEDRQHLQGLYTYLDTEKIPQIGSQMTYLQYLSPFTTENKTEIPEIPKTFNSSLSSAYGAASFNDTLYLSNDIYAIIFVYAKGQDNIKELLSGNRISLFSAGAAGIFVGGSMVAAGVSSAIGTAIVTGTFTILTGGVGVLVIGGAAAVVVGSAYIYSSLFAGTDAPQWMSVSTFKPYNASALKDMGCQIAPAHQ